MGKKQKVNKLARMSDEERARYLQHRADVEEEARRRKRELIARFIKNKLDKEETYSRMNTAKLNQGWRYILRKIKCKQLALDIKGMMDSFKFTVERKERLVSFLLKAIEESDDQHRRAFQAHTETLSYFLSIGTQRLDKVQSEYEHQKNNLLETWDKEELELTEGQERSEFKLKLIIYRQGREFQNYKKTMELQRATAKNDARLEISMEGSAEYLYEKNKKELRSVLLSYNLADDRSALDRLGDFKEHEEEMRNLCQPKELEIEMYWSQLRDVYRSYLEQHDPIMGHYNTLREKDDFYQRDIAKNEVLIQQATEIVQTLQKEYMNRTNTMACKLQRMNSRKEALAKKYWQMKREVKGERSKGSEKMEIMVNASQDAIKQFEHFKDKLNKIQHLAEICSKYEYKEDIASLKEIESDGTQLFDFENLDKDMIEECKEYSKMDKFLLKANRVKVQVLCLRAEKAKLAKENVALKHYIKRYLTNLALQGGKDAKDRPLSMKMQSAVQKIDAAGKVVNRPVTCIEGALSNAVMHEKRMKSLEQRNRLAEFRAYPRVQCWM